jgi:hypothetical protein
MRIACGVSGTNSAIRGALTPSFQAVREPGHGSYQPKSNCQVDDHPIGTWGKAKRLVERMELVK